MRQERREGWTDSGRREHGVQLSQRSRATVDTTYQLDDEQLREFRDDNWSMQEPNRELIQFLQSQQPRYKIARLSNDWPGAREQQNRMFRLEEMLGVDAMLYSCEEGWHPPEAGFYRLVCERLGVQPHEAVFVDDREQCVEGHALLACTLSCSRIRHKPSLMCRHAFYNHRSQLDLIERDQTMFEGISENC